MYLKIGGRYLYGQTKNKYIGVEKLETKLQIMTYICIVKFQEILINLDIA